MQTIHNKVWLSFSLIMVILVFFFASPQKNSPFDYTFRIAQSMLHGELGLSQKPPSWLNEFVPFENKFYSVFPLGSVLTMMPFAVTKKLGWGPRKIPGRTLVIFLGIFMTLFSWSLAKHYRCSTPKTVLLVLFFVIGNWMYVNLAFQGAWHLALGFAALGQIGCLYFLLAKQKYLLAGFFFALGFGNRTEILLLTPIMFYFIFEHCKSLPPKRIFYSFAKFCTVPFILGALTLCYNYARFHSLFDFGYARIPGVLEEDWYRHGIFSTHSIMLNLKQMLVYGWVKRPYPPYFTPSGFGGSIFWSCPFLLLLLRKNPRLSNLGKISVLAILILTILLWCHGNPGGWQYSYRYAIVLLPWLFLIAIEKISNTPKTLDWALLIFCILINAYASYLFHWTNYVQP